MRNRIPAKRAFAALVVGLLLSVQPGGAKLSSEPRVEDPGTPLASPNVHFLLNIPDVGATGGRFVGRYFYMTSTGGGVLSAGPTGGLRIFDVTDPEHPKLTGLLPLPHYENEDVDVSPDGRVALISMDKQPTRVPVGGKLFVVDVADPALPSLVSTLDLPASVGTYKDPQTGQDRYLGGPGHIANCILKCRYVYVTGASNGSVYVVDLRRMDRPRIIGRVASPAGLPNKVFTHGIIHDVNVDPSGYVWMTGSGGTAMYAPITDPLRPKLVASISKSDNAKYDQFIHHNSLRLDRTTVLVTEEDWMQPQCGQGGNPVNDAVDRGEDGSFQTWSIGKRKLAPLDTWDTELGTYSDGRAAATVICSSHWFDFNRHRVVAVGWYNQGVRFLDVSKTRNIRQVGYYLGVGSTASQALFTRGRPDIAYVIDYTRGLDILRIDNGGARARTVTAPVRSEWLAGYRGVRFDPAMGPDEIFGWACARPLAPTASGL